MKYINSFNLNGESEVFDEFIKIASEQKIIDLYDTKNNRDDSGEELIDEAHPEPAETIDSYRDNAGNVENENEQQKEDIYIANKIPFGQTSNKDVAATADLINELIVIADHMDCLGENEIAVFADNLSTRINKQAVIGWLGVGALGIVATVVGAWFLTSYSDKGDIKNTGIDYNIKKLEEQINNYLSKAPSLPTGEELSQTPQRLQDLINTLDATTKTRSSYMHKVGELSDKLRNATGLTNKSVPTSEQVKQAMQSEFARNVVKEIHDCSDRYTQIINERVLPILKNDLDYFRKYFAATKDIETAPKGFFEHIQDVFQSGLPSTGSDIIKALQSTIASLQADIELRKLDANASIDNISSRIQTDLSSEFEGKPSKSDENIIFTDFEKNKEPQKSTSSITNL